MVQLIELWIERSDTKYSKYKGLFAYEVEPSSPYLRF